jgi:hypothetical protein
MPLGDVARHVDPAEIDRNAASARALQRRQPVAGLFETGVEHLPQAVDVVAQLAGGHAEPFIGHEQGPGRIIAEPDGQDMARRCLEAAFLDDRADLLRKRERGDLPGELEPAAFDRLRRIEFEMAPLRVEPSHRPPALPGDADLLARSQFCIGTRGKCRRPRCRRPALCLAVERIDVIVRLIEPVAHFLPRQAALGGQARPDGFVHHVEPQPGLGVKRVELHEAFGKTGELQGAVRPVRREGRRATADRQGPRACADQFVAARWRKVDPVHRECGAKRIGQRAGVRWRSSFSSCER